MFDAQDVVAAYRLQPRGRKQRQLFDILGARHRLKDRWTRGDAQALRAAILDGISDGLPLPAWVDNALSRTLSGKKAIVGQSGRKQTPGLPREAIIAGYKARISSGQKPGKALRTTLAKLAVDHAKYGEMARSMVRRIRP